MNRLRERPLLTGGAIFVTLLLATILGFRVGNPGADRTIEANLDDLAEISWPAMDLLEDADRAQFMEQKQRLERTRIPGVQAESLSEIYGRLGQLFLTFDYLEPAKTAFENALALRPDDAVAMYYLGYLHARTGQLEQAAGYFERTVEQRPSDDVARVRLAEVYRGLQRPDEARPLLMESLDSAQASARARYVLGLLASDEGDDLSAIANFKSALELQPKAESLNVLIAEAWRRLGQDEKAELHERLRGEQGIRMDDPLIATLQQFRQGPRLLMQQGNQLMSEGKPEEAAQLFARAADGAPDDLSAWLNLGAARYMTDDRSGAEDAFNQALALDPDNSKARFNLALLAQDAGELDVAESELQRILDTDAQNLEARFALARLLRRRDRCDEAIEHYRAYLDLDPGTSQARLQLILCLARSGDDAMALEEAELGHAGSPENIGYLDAMVRLLASSPDVEVRDGERALTLSEELLDLLVGLESGEAFAMALAASGDFENAVRFQEKLRKSVEEERPNPAWLEFIDEQLERYRAGKTASQPWPEHIFND